MGHLFITRLFEGLFFGYRLHLMQVIDTLMARGFTAYVNFHLPTQILYVRIH